MKPEWQTYWKESARSLKGFLLALGVSLVFYLFNFPRLQGPQQHIQYILISAMYGSIIFTWIWALYAIQWAILVKQHLAYGRPLKVSRFAHIFLAATGATFGLLSAFYVESWITGEPFSLAQYWEALLISLFIAMMFQFYYAYKRSSHEYLELKAAKAESDLHVLRSQMQPHFLFNSLNTLAALIDQNPATAGEATQKLADLYRLILECSKNQLSPLGKELQIAELYLEIERVRFGSRLQISIPALAGEFKNVLVPSLILQTLAENAVKHGISKSLEGGFVKLNTHKHPDGLRLEVENSGAPLLEPDGTGTGIKNTRERLDLIFGNKHLFALARTSRGHTSASFLVPGV